MKVKINRAALHEAVHLASSIVPARTPKDILKCAKLQTEDDQSLYVIATDGDIMVNYRVPQVEIEQHGQIALPADRLASILYEAQDDVVRIEQDEATCQVYGKSSHFMVYGFDPDDFPVAMVEELPEQIEVQAGILRRMIRMTAFAVAKESSRYAINGIYCECKGKRIRMVGTDGRRLALIDGTLSKADLPESEDGTTSVIVPVKVMHTIEKALMDPEEKVQLHFTDKKVTFSNSMVKIAANLVQGRYPNYEEVIPKGAQNKATISTESFLSAIRQVALLVNESSRGVKLEFTANKIHLSSSTPEAGNAEVDIEIQYSDNDIIIGFNPDFVTDVLRVIEEPELVLEMIDGNRPGLIRVGKEYQYVIMPVNV